MSFYHATTTIDDLTLALTNHTRVPSPEPNPSLTCCCSRDNCENTKGWLAFKTKLESRLVLSAGVFRTCSVAEASLKKSCYRGWASAVIKA